MLRFFLLFFLIAGIHSLKPNHCPKVRGVPIDLYKLSDGIWYEYARNSDSWDNSERCAIQTWQLPVGGVSTVMDESFSLITNVTSRTVGKVYKANDNGLSFDFYLPFLGKTHETHWILDVDYDNYSISWYCENFGAYHNEKIWVLTRHPNPSINIEEILRNAFHKNGLAVPSFTKVDNQNCS